MKRNATALALLVGGVLCASIGAPPVLAGSTILKDFPVSGALPPNACTGEVVLISGTAKIVLRENGGVHLTVADTAAVGMDTGALWTGVGVSTQNGSAKTDGNGATNSTTTFKIRFTNGDDTFHSKLTVHMTVNANGDVTSTTSLDTVKCK